MSVASSPCGVLGVERNDLIDSGSVVVANVFLPLVSVVDQLNSVMLDGVLNVIMANMEAWNLEVMKMNVVLVALMTSLHVMMDLAYLDHGNVMYTGVIVQIVKTKLTVMVEVMLLLLQEQRSLQIML